MRELTVPEAAYIAGILDGEGCLSVYRGGKCKWYKGECPRFRASALVANTHLPLLEKLQSLIGGRIRRAHEGGIGQDGYLRKACYELWLGPVVLRELLPQLIPYMIVKRKQAELVSEFLSLNGGSVNWKYRSSRGRLVDIVNDIRLLNTRRSL